MTDKILADCLTDGIDQTALLLMGEGHGRRNYMTHYDGGAPADVRYEDFKVPIKPARNGLPGIDFYNNLCEPGEKYGKLYLGLFAVAPIQQFIGSHKAMIKKFPHRDPAESKPQHVDK